MEHLLYLSHRLPYPPNKGDKIRSWHFLAHLATRYHVHLGTFIDDPEDAMHLPHLQQTCASVCAIPISPRWRRLASLRGLLNGEALSLAYYRDRALAAWVKDVLRRHNPSRAVVFSSPMGQYLDTKDASARRLLVDFVDVDSEKWRAYAAQSGVVERWIYQREARHLFAWEARLAARASVATFVSAAEANLFNSLLPRPLSSVTHIDNGVDLGYFDPELRLPDPWPADGERFVFTGAMDYRANADAVVWFCREIWPGIRHHLPRATFAIVGARPVDEVMALNRQPGVIVTGTVPDVRPWLAHAHVMVAPLRIARGVQNKVLEAMAMGLPVVGTNAAFEGIGTGSSPALRVADDAAGFGLAAREFAASQRAGAEGLRAQVARTHDWGNHLARLQTLLEETP